ncbi:MAG: outer membrane beta-barrel protein [Bacteroidales bacterium]|nr:outer membrane beta-barrel protein [Bacteroidales bacterium]
MNKTLSSSIVLLFFLFSLSSYAECHFGIKGGLNLSYLKVKGDHGYMCVDDDFIVYDINLNPDNKNGYFIGPTVIFGMPVKCLSVETSLLFNRKVVELDPRIQYVSSKDLLGSFGDDFVYLEYANESPKEDNKLKQNLLSIPINVLLSKELCDVFGIYCSVGHQIDFNLGEKKWNGIKGFEWEKVVSSVNASVGVILVKHIQIGATYNRSLSKIADVNDDMKNMIPVNLDNDIKIKTNTFMFSVAYMF